MKTFCGLAFAAAALAFSVAALTCPDWPFCKGALAPTLAGGIMLEWSHRLLALLASLAGLAAILAGWRVRRVLAGLTPVLVALGFVFLVAVVPGGTS